METIKSSHGVVVDDKESGVRYAMSDQYFNPEAHTYVRDLRPGETVRGYQPKAHPGAPQGSLEAVDQPGAPTQDAEPAESRSETPEAQPTKTEGTAPADSQEKKGK